MDMLVFSVRDMKAEAFLQPFFSPTRGSAMRAFGDACDKQDSPFFMHPNDFVLYEIGRYDDATGLITPLQLSMIACASDFRVAAGSTVEKANLDSMKIGLSGA